MSWPHVNIKQITAAKDIVDDGAPEQTFEKWENTASVGPSCLPPMIQRLSFVGQPFGGNLMEAPPGTYTSFCHRLVGGYTREMTIEVLIDALFATENSAPIDY